ncbi:MAG: sigma factor-like helix-turn-helix DNA-binding protein [Patescibacteria group bacterium]
MAHVSNPNEILQRIARGDFLTPREQKILSLRLEGKTLQEVGVVIGVTRERVRQIGERIRRKLNKNLSQQEIDDYIVAYSSRQKGTSGRAS